MYLSSTWYLILLFFVNSEQKEKFYEDRKVLKIHSS